MANQDANRRILKLVQMAGELLKEAADIGETNGISFETTSNFPFELKYKIGGRWECGDRYWEDSGCSIDVNDLDEDTWSSSSNC